ncbi:MAG: NfeD family protein [Pseudobdellovibrionaceae bacterium]
MTGLILVLLAFVLIIAETHLPTFGLLGVLALVSLLAGGQMIVEQGGLFGIPIGWDVFIGIAAGMVIFTIWVGRISYKALTMKALAGNEGLIGREARIIEWDGAYKGRVQIQGEIWQALSEHPHDFKPDTKVIISAIEDLVLKVHVKD